MPSTQAKNTVSQENIHKLIDAFETYLNIATEIFEWREDFFKRFGTSKINRFRISNNQYFQLAGLNCNALIIQCVSILRTLIVGEDAEITLRMYEELNKMETLELQIMEKKLNDLREGNLLRFINSVLLHKNAKSVNNPDGVTLMKPRKNLFDTLEDFNIKLRNYESKYFDDEFKRINNPILGTFLDAQVETLRYWGDIIGSTIEDKT